MPLCRRVLPILLLLSAVRGLHGADYDLIVYGGTSSGVIAAVQAKRMGQTVLLISPDRHVGGMTSGGLGFTDIGNKRSIGGLSKEFYHRIWLYYNRPQAWTWQQRDQYGGVGQDSPAIDNQAQTMTVLEPHVAEAVYEGMLKEYGVPVARDEWLDREHGVHKEGNRIESITTLSGHTYSARMFIDASYEGDLMAAAGVEYRVGRESKAAYGEEYNGVQVGVLFHRHNFGVLPAPISAYKVPGDPSSGLLPLISAEPPGAYGTADSRVQAYCFRLCMTQDPRNQRPIPKPEGYDPARYELLLRVFRSGWRETFTKFDPIPNAKTDVNNHGPVGFDYLGANYAYPDASYAQRREILEDHKRYQEGLLYFIANDPRMPEEVRTQMKRWGLAADEFQDNGNWPLQLYIREARRMVGVFVMTENELRHRRPTPESVGMGSYGIDSHNVQRYVTADGSVQNEGDIGVPTGGPYQIAYGALLPKKAQCENLVVPVALSSSHIAYGSMRMEPVFMVLGQSAATAACLAVRAKVAVQDLPYADLAKQLLSDGQVLALPGVSPQSGEKGP